MGRIQRAAGSKHDSTLSAYVASFVSQATQLALPALPAHLDTFPRQWPFPRGDMHHWIPLLDRFDHILELVTTEYGLQKGPQTLSFTNVILLRGDGDKDEERTEEELRAQKYHEAGDRQLVQAILEFSTLLLQNCSNRSVYSSMDHLDSLLNTTSLALLKHTLRTTFCLAHRYWAARTRASVSHTHLSIAYSLTTARLDKLAGPLGKPSLALSSITAAGKGKQKASAAKEPHNPNDFSGLLKRPEVEESLRQQYAEINFTYYETEAETSATEDPSSPASPSLNRRSGQAEGDATARRGSKWGTSGKTIHISAADLSKQTIGPIMAQNYAKLTPEYQYELLHQLRIARAFQEGSAQDLRDLVHIRLLAVSNLAYVYTDSQFVARVGQADSEQPKDLQLPYQLTDLLQPLSDGTEAVPKELATAAVNALEALSLVKSKAADVAAALNIGVSHGILFYLLRKAMASLDTDHFDPVVSEWREAILTLVHDIAQIASNYNRSNEQMVAAGVVSIYVQPLTLRTTEAERTWLEIMSFFDTFVNNGVRDAFQSMVDANGPEVLAKLLSYLVDSSLEEVRNGHGMPEEWRTSITEYRISFYKQQSLRLVLKFIVHLFGHNQANTGRHLRNLIDTPLVLKSLQSILANGAIFGSNVWISAVNIVANFIHNEPTSYNIIHEAGLSAAILDAIAPPDAEGIPEPDGVLPVSETMRDIPQAFGAICLNEAGMKLFEKSQALNTYLRIFTSVDHVSALEENTDSAVHIGQLFDELVRHHPELQDQVHNAVMVMLKRVVQYCRGRAMEDGAGAKLWLSDDEGKLIVAGGRKALTGCPLRAGALDKIEADAEPVTVDQVESNAMDKTQPSGRDTSNVVSVASKFLQGYLNNANMLTKLCEDGGASLLLDLAECPCSPWNLQDFAAYDELERALALIAEQKPHFVLPSLVYRAKEAVAFLEPLLQHSGYDAYFEPLTKPGDTSSRAEDAISRAQRGTYIVKGLVAAQVLINLLADIFQSPSMYGPRSAPANYFTQINLTDLYVDLVEKLGRLHSTCIWEEYLLVERLPSAWKTPPTNRPAKSASTEADNVDLLADVAGTLAALTEDKPDAQAASTKKAESQDLAKKYPADYENSNILHMLLSQIPNSIIYFCQQLSRALYTKTRTPPDTIQRQNATLVAEQLAKSAVAQYRAKTPTASLSPVNRLRYEKIVLSSTTKLLMDRKNSRNGQPDLHVVVLNQFYLQGGFEELRLLLKRYASELEKHPESQEFEHGSEHAYLVASSELIMDIFSKITSDKILEDSPQYSALHSFSSNDTSSFSIFDSSQLLVEMRFAVMNAIKPLWEPENDDVLTTRFNGDAIRCILKTLKSTLEAGGERKAFSKSNPRSREIFVKSRWRPRHPEYVNTLRDEGFDRTLAQEALFRCNENRDMARDYCNIRNKKGMALVERLPPPVDDVEASTTDDDEGLPVLIPVPSIDMEDAGDDESVSSSDEVMSDDADPMASLILNPNALLGDLASRTPRTGTASGSGTTGDATSTEAAQPPAAQPPAANGTTTTPEVGSGTIFVEDLDDKRKALRKDLVDRCLDILHSHTDVTFDVADLIMASTSGSKVNTEEIKAVIGETLVSTLISLKEEAATENKRIAAVAHLLALIMQDDDFFRLSLPTLKEQFTDLVDLLKVPAEAEIKDCTAYLGKVLLLMERILVEDERPPEVGWVPPTAQNLDVTQPPIELPAELVSMEMKQSIFAAILELLPRVGNNEMFALSLTRVLVLLTRRRQIAKQLAAKPNIGRLFLMVKQLSGMTADKLQVAFLIVLRHLMEDEETVRQIMRTEIQLAFETSRMSRPMDTVNYVKHYYHLVLRDPEMFVEMTNEKAQLHRLELGQKPQALVLKKEEKPKPAPLAAGDFVPAEASASTAVPSTEKSEPEHIRQPLERTKTSDTKPPTVENSDGVIHHILKELSAYRDVEDREVSASKSENKTETMPSLAPAESFASASDIEMSDASALTPAASASSTPTNQGSQPPKSDKIFFRTDDHPIYAYRCTLLQCLVELLSSYKKSKIEFINFSPKGDVSTTPSKPRSGILNYLLTTLIPLGTINHVDGVEARKKASISNWAISVVVALVTKSHERAVRDPTTKAFEEEPDLTFVRRFVLEQALKALNSAMHSTESLDMRYSRFLALADLFHRMLSTKPNGVNNAHNTELVITSSTDIGKLMYEKNFISALTATIAEVDLNFPNAKRCVKYVLRPLKMLTDTALKCNLSPDSSMPGTTDEDDDISSATSITSNEDEHERDATPDIFRNSTLGQFEAGREDDSDSSGDEDGEEYYGDEYDEDEMDYEEEEERDHGEVHSDEDDDLSGMGPIEGVPGDVDMDVELVMDDDDSSSGSSGSSDSDSDEDDHDEDDEEEMEDDIHIIDEVTGDNENDSGAEGNDDEADWEDEDEDDDDDGGPDTFNRLFPGVADRMFPGAADRGTTSTSPLDTFVRALQGGPPGADLLERIGNADMALNMNMDEDYFDDEMAPEDEEDEEDEEEIDYDNEVVYEAGMDLDEAYDEEENDDDWDYRHPTTLHRGHHHSMRAPPIDGWAGRGVPFDAFSPLSRSHRTHARGGDDGTNPLLQRSERPPFPAFPGHGRRELDAVFADHMGGPAIFGRGGPGAMELPAALADLLQGVTGGRSTVNIVDEFGALHSGRGYATMPPPAYTIPPPFTVIPGTNGGIGFAPHLGRRGAGLRGLATTLHAPGANIAVLSQRPPTYEPHQAMSFSPALTVTRWQDEARIMYGPTVSDTAARVNNSLLRALTPAAVEAKRQKDKADAEKKETAEKAEAERKKKEEADRLEKETAERKEREEKEAREREEAAQRAAEAQETSDADADASMEGVEPSSPAAPAADTTVEEPEPRTRIMAMVRGQEVDITDLGIDPEFLQEIPEDMRDDVIMAQLQQRLESRPARPAPVAAPAAPAQTSEPIDRDFLNALPEDIQQELLRAEAIERNRRNNDTLREQMLTTAVGNFARRAEEMTPSDFMATLDPSLRRSVLAEADEPTLASLPEGLRAEAQALINLYSRNRVRGDDGSSRRPRDGAEAVYLDPPAEQQRPKRHFVQILDKAGVATLLRLMFIQLSGSAKQAMLGILVDITRNPQNRAEVISILLGILQDGSSDGPALDKSFTQLTLRAKQMSGPKTPQPLRRTLTGSSVQVSPPNTDATPLTIVQQCIAALMALAEENPRIGSFFMTEHDMITNQRNKTPKKGKSKDNKVQRYPINALLTLLDRRTIIDNPTVMEHLAALLVKISEPLKVFLRRAKIEERKAEAEQAAAATAAATAASETEASETEASVPAASETTEGAPSNNAGGDVAMAEAQTKDETKDGSQIEADKKKPRDAPPPDIPEENLCLVVNIIAARECNSRTFQNTIDLINYLSAIPGARDIFGRELVRRAQDLGMKVLEDLKPLPAQIRNAESSTEMQGRALAAFSPATSHQNKLLRVLLALDYIFDAKRSSDRPASSALARLAPKSRSDLISSMYNDATFVRLWTSLSECLTAIRERGGMNNVATILQPLVEAFMVVCKNTAAKEVAVTPANDVHVSSPPPETRMDGLFFSFTEEHRKILNDLVRQNPKLMSGTFDVLVKNSKVLEFDNKRSFFSKRLHQRPHGERHNQPTLQLNVRRNDVFMDSFKALFFKKPDEIKYGKFNIRFAREEGVDAGGVTREWFAAISRQMFNPNYALFNPVAADRTTFHPNPLSVINEQHLTFFKFIGRIIGKALYENRVLDCHFSRAVYKRILGKPVSLKDMETLDLEYYKSLVWMLENDITDIAFETFSTEVDRFGEMEVVDLKPNGRNIPVTEENKHEYVRLVVEQRLTKSVEEQLEHFLQGFRDIVPLELISIFNEQELELLISGLPDIDVADWKNNTDYQNYNATSPQVQWFWRAVRSFDKEEQAKLLQFVTGTSKVPLNGFKELEGMNGFSKFSIHRDFGNKDRLPSSHTCFNQLDLPEYDSYEILRKQIYTAMTVGSDHFGFA